MSKEKMPEKEVQNMTTNPNNKSDSENSNANGNEESQIKRRRYNRHTTQQIQELEAFFNECPHPDDGQRTELSQRLGMELQQIKFWFQNKRTQMKAQREHKEIGRLRAEIEKLEGEIVRLKKTLSNASCPRCGAPIPVKEISFDEHQLRLHNSRLRQEIEQITSVSANYGGRSIVPSTSTPPASSSQQFKSRVNRNAISADVWSAVNNEAVPHNEGTRSVVHDVATSAMEELMRVAQLGEPLWVPSIGRNSSVLNEEEYFRAFARVFTQKTDGFKSEASRESVVVAMRAATVVEILMDVVQWGNVFSGIVSRAVNLDIISSGQGLTYNEALVVVNAEFQVPSPLVPTRETCFLRYCKRQVDGMWAVVDVSIDHMSTTPSVTCRRRPSGCLIQDIANGLSKVTWVEHVEIKDGGIHSIYKPLITSGLAFGARRWIAILEGYSQRLIRTFSTGSANDFLDQLGRRSMLKVAEEMVTRFCCGVNASVVNKWTNLSGIGNENVKFISRTNVDDPSMPYGLLLTIATSIWIAVPPKTVFNFLSDINTRKLWDMLLNGGDVEEITHILSGKEEFNRVTLYQVKGASSSSSSSHMTLLQESRSDPTASYVVYAPIDMDYANAVLGGEDPTSVPLLPSGFAIFPDGPTGRGQGRGIATHADTGGSLLTVALQILIDSSPSATLSMGTAVMASKLMWSSVDKIKQALLSNS